MLAVELERVGKPHLYPEPDFELKSGDHVVVETARGTELGKVISTSIPFVGETPTPLARPSVRIRDEQLELPGSQARRFGIKLRSRCNSQQTRY